MTAVSPHQILALNDAQASENRMHSDDIALKYGFNGALVSGVNVFGYLSQPLVRHHGADWLNRGVLDVKFIKPAYQDNLLTIQTEAVNSEPEQRANLTSAFNEQGVLLATLESWLPKQLPEINPLAYSNNGLQAVTAEEIASSEIDRPEIEWDLIHIDKTETPFLWQPTEEENLQHVNAQRDQSSLYLGADGHIHPYFLLNACNKALMRMFVLPAWIHTGSRMVIRNGLHAGQSIEVRTTCIEKWERKGHQFIKLYIAMLLDGVVAVETEHSAIFNIAS